MNWREAEEIACRFLITKGYIIVGRNVRSGRVEIDIVAEKEGLTVIVEVKSRSTLNFIQISKVQRRNICQFISVHLANRFVRVDVVVVFTEDRIEHLENFYLF